ncbi:MAG: alpha-N-arabinofuranosidase, partial [Dehalococcoidales bacterium]|nr:alpha-N-arabinofuranosidase [Dehalococcoidales bacterium]
MMSLKKVKRLNKLNVALVSLVFSLFGQSLSAGELTIDAFSPGKEISPNLVGVFFEDLNYAADGGLYAELVQNRSFEYTPADSSSWNALSFWSVEKTGNGDGSIAIGNYRPVHKNNPNYALLTINRPGDGVGLANTGYDGVPVIVGAEYNFSFWAYQPFMNEKWGGNSSIVGKPMPVTARLVSKDGKVLAEAKLEVAGRDWTKYSAVLKSAATDNQARLVLLGHAKGGLALDMISLMPKDTFMGRPNGLRKDLAQLIADIKPKFMRFPGGCLVHGSGIHQYYDWKNTVGPVEQRIGGRNLWGYGQTMGLGYFEFF